MKGSFSRKTKETDVYVVVDIEGGGVEVETPVPFLNHMLEAFGVHGGFGLEVRAKGDVEVDLHHTVEDVGMVLGGAFKKAIEGVKVKRFGYAIVPMDDALVLFSMDISGRSFVSCDPPLKEGRVGEFPLELIEEFFWGFSRSLGANVHIKVLSGWNKHHMAEAVFKAFGLSMRDAVGKREGDVSTKGVL